MQEEGGLCGVAGVQGRGESGGAGGGPQGGPEGAAEGLGVQRRWGRLGHRPEAGQRVCVWAGKGPPG